jgi:hypothetical protein
MMIKSRIMRGGERIFHVLGRGEVHILLWWGDLKQENHLQGLSIDGGYYWILKWVC